MKGPTISRFDKIVVVGVIIGLAITYFYFQHRALNRAEKDIQIITSVLIYNLQQGRLFNIPQPQAQAPAPKPEEKAKEKK